jgi:hypothetical protein
VDLSFLDTAAERRKAYGRLETAVKKSGNDSVLAVYEAAKSSKENRDSKMRKVLEDWMIDPTFATCVLKNSTLIEEEEEKRESEETVSRSRCDELQYNIAQMTQGAC